MNDDIPRMGQGMVWQDLHVGQRWRTFRRTITEADLVNFINATGMLEAIFIEDGYAGAAMRGRAVPGALTYTFIEGFILQSMIQGTGLAMLELHQKILAPVCVSGGSDGRAPHLQGQPRGRDLAHRSLQPAPRAGDGIHRHAPAGRATRAVTTLPART